MTEDLDRLAINSATVRQMPLVELIDECAALGVGAVTPWRDQVQSLGVAVAARRFRDAGVAVSAYCRAGLFAASSAEERERIMQDNGRLDRPDGRAPRFAGPLRRASSGADDVEKAEQKHRRWPFSVSNIPRRGNRLGAAYRFGWVWPRWP